MAKLTQIGSELSLADTRFTSKATIKLNSDIKASLTHRTGEPQAVALTLTGKNWEVAHDFQKKDTRLKWKADVGEGKLTVKQTVPAGNWALVPNPTLEYSRGGLLGGAGKLVAGYDCLDRVGTLEQTLYGGWDRQHKAWLKVSSHYGPAAGVRSKLRAGPLLHSAAASFSRKDGPHLHVKSKFADGTKVKTSFTPKTQILTIAAKHSPKGLEGPKPTVTLGIVAPLNQRKEPKVTLGVKWDL
ncbi:hypothetical protein ABPG77_009582 [Micractinium sp. CCAP 211/92]